MKKTIWLKDFSESIKGNNYINYKGYIIWQGGNGDGKWHSGSGHYWITNNLQSEIIYCGTYQTSDFEKMESSIWKKKRCALSLKNCKTLIDKHLPEKDKELWKTEYNFHIQSYNTFKYKQWYKNL
tara:strand:+ start:103 stop:477 length:375 start_codon:yes stop_codon:yes gene_type:complete